LLTVQCDLAQHMLSEMYKQLAFYGNGAIHVHLV
jgi:hypothetical protein